MALPLILIGIGCALLVKGADALVGGASSLATRLKISSVLVGMTVVAFGTTMPEFVVSMMSAYRGTAELAVGNVIGSVIANIGLILGIAAVITPITVERDTVWREIPRAFLAAMLVVVMANDVLLDGGTRNVLGRSDGIILLLFFALYLYHIFGRARDGGMHLFGMGKEKQLDLPDGDHRPTASIFFKLAVGAVALAVGGKLVVDGALALAAAAGLPPHVIGVTVVAVGTSLPELVTAIVASLRGKTDIGIGNVIGANILNVFFILGLTATISPLSLHARSLIDAAVAAAFSALLFAFMFVGKRHTIERWQGAFMVALYVMGVTTLFMIR